jgi:hypothetical protein
MTQVEALFVRTNSTIQFDGDLSKLAPVKIGVIQSTSYGEKIDGMINTGAWNKVSKTISIDSLVRCWQQNALTWRRVIGMYF